MLLFANAAASTTSSSITVNTEAPADAAMARTATCTRQARGSVSGAGFRMRRKQRKPLQNHESGRPKPHQEQHLRTKQQLSGAVATPAHEQPTTLPRRIEDRAQIDLNKSVTKKKKRKKMLC